MSNTATKTEYIGDGSTKLYNFSFPYISEDHVKVSLDGDILKGNTYTFASANVISFNEAPAFGVLIRIYRDTDSDSLVNTFYPGSAIRARDLNDNFTQTLYIVEEDSNAAGESSAIALEALDKATEALDAVEVIDAKADDAVVIANQALDAAVNGPPPVDISDTSPESSKEGDLWWADSDIDAGGGRLYIYTGREWVDTSLPGGGGDVIFNDLYLSKISDDTAAGELTFKKGITVEDSAYIQNNLCLNVSRDQAQSRLHVRHTSDSVLRGTNTSPFGSSNLDLVGGRNAANVGTESGFVGSLNFYNHKGYDGVITRDEGAKQIANVHAYAQSDNVTNSAAGILSFAVSPAGIDPDTGEVYTPKDFLSINQDGTVIVSDWYDTSKYAFYINTKDATDVVGLKSDTKGTIAFNSAIGLGKFTGDERNVIDFQVPVNSNGQATRSILFGSKRVSDGNTSDESTQFIKSESGSLCFNYKNTGGTRFYALDNDVENLAYAIDKDGKVGIGYSAPEKVLDISDANDPFMRIRRGSSYYWDIGHKDSNFQFISQTGGAVMHLAYNNKVGIGTESPTQSLDVVGGGNFTGRVDANQFRASQGGTEALPTIMPGNDNDTGIYHPANNSIGFTTAGSEAMRITPAGDVGIGASTPQATLHISSANSSGRILIDTSTVTSGYDTRIDATNEGLEFTAKSNSRAIVFNTGSTPTPKVTIKGGGNVGIGTTDPSEKLEVAGKIKASGITFGDSTLDFYKTGTFTPTIDSGDLQSPTTLQGEYTKIGNVVTVRIKASWSSVKTLAAGAYEIGGLPYTAGSKSQSLSGAAHQNSTIRSTIIDGGSALLLDNTINFRINTTTQSINNIGFTGSYIT